MYSDDGASSNVATVDEFLRSLDEPKAPWGFFHLIIAQQVLQKPIEVAQPVDALMWVCAVYESHAGCKRERGDHASTMEGVVCLSHRIVPLDDELVSVCTN